MRKGFTLIELLLYIGLLSVFLLVLLQFFTSILDVFSESRQSSALMQDARFILSRVSYDIRRASVVSTPLNLGEEASSLVLLIDGSSYTYATASGKLQLTDVSGAEDLNSPETEIADMRFRKIGNLGGKPTIQVNLGIKSVARRASGPEQASFQTTIGTR